MVCRAFSETSCSTRLWLCGFREQANLINAGCFKLPFDALYWLRGDVDGASVAGNARRPPHAVSLSDAKAFILDEHVCEVDAHGLISLQPADADADEAPRTTRSLAWAMRSTALARRPQCLARAPRRMQHRLSPADVEAILRATELTFLIPATPSAPAQLMSLHEFWRRVTCLARTHLHPSRYMMRDSVSDREAVRNEGFALFIVYKALLACVHPWKADHRSPWFQRLLRDQPAQARVMEQLNFVGNATCLAQSSHEFFIAGSRLILYFGWQAEQIHEEAFEHLLLWWWLICFCMGGRFASQHKRLRFAVLLLATGVWAGFPSIARLGNSAFIHAQYKKDKIPLASPVPPV